MIKVMEKNKNTTSPHPHPTPKKKLEIIANGKKEKERNKNTGKNKVKAYGISLLHQFNIIFLEKKKQFLVRSYKENLLIKLWRKY